MAGIIVRALLVAGLSGLTVTQKHASAGPTGAAIDMTTGFQQAQWGHNVVVSYADGKMTFVSDGIPNHRREAQYAIPGRSGPTAMADPTRAQDFRYAIPLSPVPSAHPTKTNMGVIGVMISGAALFNPFEGDGRSVAMQSNFAVLNAKGDSVWFLDSCNGHPQPTMGTYHYHALPTCIVSVIDGSQGPSHMLGVALDGYPIYGDRDMQGGRISASSLDTCNGIDSPTPEFPNGVYHYVLLDTKSANSSINCFHGEVDPALQQRGMHGGMQGGVQGGRPSGPPRGPSGGRRPPSSDGA